MKADDGLGALLDALVTKASRPRGRALSFLTRSSVTSEQAVLLSLVLSEPGCTPTTLAAKMSLSLPSVSQMIERLVTAGLVRRIEHPRDRRKRTIEVTPKSKTFLARLRSVRIEELESALGPLSASTRTRLASAIVGALRDLGG
ncbi:MAG: MarR family transcriptional regulator [Labilithrix sp.]|nr:MarR family transcriptional regulator [Labilithrix sp.]